MSDKPMTALDALRNYQKQCGEEGIEVQVSRQALVEVLDGYAALEAENARLLRNLDLAKESCGEWADLVGALVEGCEGLDTYTQEVACLYREEGGEWIRRDQLTALLDKVKEQRKCS